MQNVWTEAGAATLAWAKKVGPAVMSEAVTVMLVVAVAVVGIAIAGVAVPALINFLRPLLEAAFAS